MTIAVIYHYYELNETYKENFVFFLNTSIVNGIEYFFYISGSCSVELPNLPNAQYKNIENKNNDYGGLVEFYKNKKSLDFETYIFINSSVRGPFLPSYYLSNWYDLFTSRLSDRVAMVGSSINLLPSENFQTNLFSEKFNHFNPPYIHVQTAAYALSSDGFQVLIDNNFFNVTEVLNKNDVVSSYEILLSQLLLHNGFSIASILSTYEEFSLSKKDVKFPGTTKDGDPLFKSAFYGRTLSPYECVFIKTNRDLISDKELASYTFTSLIRNDVGGFLTKDGSNLFQKAAEKSNVLSKIITNEILPPFIVKNARKGLFFYFKEYTRSKKHK
tara:strand:+ start:483 stop:1469 length:987 start_codon:yes stop_codon:yes gene_type:complete